MLVDWICLSSTSDIGSVEMIFYSRFFEINGKIKWNYYKNKNLESSNDALVHVPGAEQSNTWLVHLFRSSDCCRIFFMVNEDKKTLQKILISIELIKTKIICIFSLSI